MTKSSPEYFILTTQDVKKESTPQEKFRWGATPYEERQVFGALFRVPASLCINKCPFFKKFKRGLNKCGQAGACYRSTFQASWYGMKGVPSCHNYKKFK